MSRLSAGRPFRRRPASHRTAIRWIDSAVQIEINERELSKQRELEKASRQFFVKISYALQRQQAYD